MNFKKVPISQVRPWQDNPRGITTRDFERLKRQILDLGVYKPLVVTKEDGHYIVLGGNMRIRALKDIGVTEVEISIVDAKTKAQKLKYSMSDNDRAGFTEEDKLAELVFETKDQIKDLDMFRIDLAPSVSIDKILDAFGPTQDAEEDQMQKPVVKAISRPGDLFTLGRHRLLCGDATAADDYSRLMNGKKADIIFTDPPYNVAYQGQKFAEILNDNMGEEGFIKFVETWMERFKDSLKKGGVFYICSGYVSFPAFVYAIKKTGMTFSGPIIWVKNAAAVSWNDYRRKHEMILKGSNTTKKAQPILYGWNGGRHYFFESRSEADVWEINRKASGTMFHPTQKPLGMVQRAIKNSSRPDEIVLDPFAGSGTTLIAAEREGRQARLIELDPVYVDVIIRRYAALGGPTEAEIRATREAGSPRKGRKAAALRTQEPATGISLARRNCLTRTRKAKAGRTHNMATRIQVGRTSKAPELRQDAQHGEPGSQP